ncbi:hypothetical protein [Microcoleus sp. D3_18_C2]|uniref:hypothetical protein n=1 Tax=Microcoleus sp. D3_18_C2 TaxID=3055334 RepID=UPI002FD65A96
MRRIRLFALGIVSFFAVLMSALLAPGTIVNRALSAALCTVFSFNTTICTVNLVNSSDRVVAATPPAMERNISDWLVQRDPGEFDDAPSVPAGSNPQAPPFPQDPGPNQPLRPDFDNPGSGQPETRPQVDQPNPSQPIQQQPNFSFVEGIWIYSAYADISPDSLIFTKTVKITNTGDDPIFSVCENCQKSQLPSSFFASKIPQEQALVADIQDLNSSIEVLESTDSEAIWGVIYEHNSTNAIYFTLGKIPNTSPRISLINDTFSKGKNLILASNNFLQDFLEFSPISIDKNSYPASQEVILNSQIDCSKFFQSVQRVFNNVKNIPRKETKIPNTNQTSLPNPPRNVNRVDIELGTKGGEAQGAADGARKMFLERFFEKMREIEELLRRNKNKGDTFYPQKNQYNSQLWATTSFPKQEPYIVAQCIPPRVLAGVARWAPLAALAGATGAVADWCIKNPEGCKLLARNPGATARAIGGQINHQLQNFCYGCYTGKPPNPGMQSFAWTPNPGLSNTTSNLKPEILAQSLESKFETYAKNFRQKESINFTEQLASHTQVNHHLSNTRLAQLNIPGLPNIPGVPGGAGNILKDAVLTQIAGQLGGFVENERAFTTGIKDIYPTVAEAPGGEFKANPANLQIFSQALRSANGSPEVQLPPGDYEIPGQVFCFKPRSYGPQTSVGYPLAPIKGKQADALIALNSRHIAAGIPHDSAQVLSWNIQLGVKYEDMPPESKAIVDKIMPEFKQQLSRSFWEDLQAKWGQISSTIPGVPSFDSVLGQLPGEMSQILKTYQEGRAALQRYRDNFDQLQNEMVLQGEAPSDSGDSKYPRGIWSKVSDRVYARLLPTTYNGPATMQIRVLDPNGNAVK